MRLGKLDHKPILKQPKEEGRGDYWATHAGRICTLVKSFKPPIAQLIITASFTHNNRFKAVVNG